MSNNDAQTEREFCIRCGRDLSDASAGRCSDCKPPQQAAPPCIRRYRHKTLIACGIGIVLLLFGNLMLGHLAVSQWWLDLLSFGVMALVPVLVCYLFERANDQLWDKALSCNLALCLRCGYDLARWSPRATRLS